jgi:hypothetical protein
VIRVAALRNLFLWWTFGQFLFICTIIWLCFLNITRTYRSRLTILLVFPYKTTSLQLRGQARRETYFYSILFTPLILPAAVWPWGRLSLCSLVFVHDSHHKHAVHFILSQSMAPVIGALSYTNDRFFTLFRFSQRCSWGSRSSGTWRCFNASSDPDVLRPSSNLAFDGRYFLEEFFKDV